MTMSHDYMNMCYCVIGKCARPCWWSPEKFIDYLNLQNIPSIICKHFIVILVYECSNAIYCVFILGIFFTKIS